MAYYEQGNLDEAEKQYQKAIQTNPNYVEAHNNLGNIYFRKERFEEALAEYKKTVEIKPDYAQGYFNLGSTYLQQNKPEEAIESFQRALEINPKYARPTITLPGSITRKRIINCHRACGSGWETGKSSLIHFFWSDLNPIDKGKGERDMENVRSWRVWSSETRNSIKALQNPRSSLFLEA